LSESIGATFSDVQDVSCALQVKKEKRSTTSSLFPHSNKKRSYSSLDERNKENKNPLNNSDSDSDSSVVLVKITTSGLNKKEFFHHVDCIKNRVIAEKTTSEIIGITTQKI